MAGECRRRAINCPASFERPVLARAPKIGVHREECFPLKYCGGRLVDALQSQSLAVAFVTSNGQLRYNVSAAYVANEVRIGGFIGFARNGIVERVQPLGYQAPLRGHPDIAAARMRETPRLPQEVKKQSAPLAEPRRAGVGPSKHIWVHSPATARG